MRTVDLVNGLFGEMLVHEDPHRLRSRFAIMLEGVSGAGKTMFLELLQATLPPGKLGKWAVGQDTLGPEGIRDTWYVRGPWMLVFEEVETPTISRDDAIKAIDGTPMECRQRRHHGTLLPVQD